MFSRLRQLLRRGRDEGGFSAVEFAIVLPLLLLLILGGMDLGHSYYIKYTITNASREGARYASKYTGTSAPNSQTISDFVKLPAGVNYNSFNLTNLVVSGSYSGASPNQNITVTVNADKNWWILGGLLGLPNPTTLTATTAMVMESP